MNSQLRAARSRRRWRQKDVVAAIRRLEERLEGRARSTVGIDENAIGRYEKGRIAPSDFYKARLCLVFEVDRPEELGWDPLPGLMEEIEDLRSHLKQRSSPRASGLARQPDQSELTRTG